MSNRRVLIIDLDECPPNVRYLLLADNPCALLPSYRLGLIKECERLEELDDLPITKQEKRMARGEFSGESDESDTEEEEKNEITGENDQADWAMSPSLYDERVALIRQRSKGRRDSLPSDSAKRLDDLRIKFKEDVIARLQIKS
jgi:hypothetical protein